jgi:hypothetical protein
MPGLYATRTDDNAFHLSVLNGLDFLKVRVEFSFVYIVGVTHRVAHSRFFAA